MPVSSKNLFGIIGGLVVMVIWIFPNFWYTKEVRDEGREWFEERTEISGWEYVDKPVAESAEKALVADTVFNAEFNEVSTGNRVLAFSARRMKEDMNEIGLFVHTPDRCWTEGGWNIVPVQPETVSVTIGEREIQFERRVFDFQGHKQLVYFSGLIGGQTLPYRLDHNLSVAMRYQLDASRETATGTSARSNDERFWQRIWESFLSRRKITGPKQFIRVSTELFGGADEEDTILQAFLAQWLG